MRQEVVVIRATISFGKIAEGVFPLLPVGQQIRFPRLGQLITRAGSAWWHWSWRHLHGIGDPANEPCGAGADTSDGFDRGRHFDDIDSRSAIVCHNPFSFAGIRTWLTKPWPV